jgi:hypothetical protein
MQKKEIKGHLNARLGLEAPFPECVLIDILLSQSQRFSYMIAKLIATSAVATSSPSDILDSSRSCLAPSASLFSKLCTKLRIGLSY